MLFVKVRINIKSYNDFMFFSTVCSSFKGFKCVIQKLEEQKNLEICQTSENRRNFVKPRKIALKFANAEK